MRIDVQQFRRACDTLVQFTQQHTGLTDEERKLVVTVVQTLEHPLAPSALQPNEAIFTPGGEFPSPGYFE